MPRPGGRVPLLAWETWCLAGLLAAVLALNLATGQRSPAVWIDEVAYADPAVNVWLGRGFTSSAWYAQGDTEFWAGNVPLYSAMLYVWLRLFGFSIVAVRSINYLLIIPAIVLLWLGVRRHGLISSPGWRLFMVALVLLGFCVCFSYRSGRPDVLCILLACVAFLACTITHKRLRLAAVCAVGVLFPIAGLHLVAYALVLWGVLLPFLGRRYLAEWAALGIGCLLGGLALFAFYSFHGVWEQFVASTVGTHAVGGAEGRLRWRIPGGLKDPSFLLLLLAALVLAVALKRQGRFVWRSPLGFALAAGLIIPLSINLLRKTYPCYYGWMAYIPVSVTLCAALAARPPLPRLIGKVAMPMLVGLACLAGLPVVTVLTLLEWDQRDYRHVEQLIQRHVRPEDVVFCEGAAYYALKLRNPLLTGLRRLWSASPEEAARINVLVMNPSRFELAQKSVGGQWRACESPPLLSQAPRLGIETEYFLDRYRLCVYRRQTQLAAAEPLRR